MARLLSLHVVSGIKEGALLEFPANRKKITIGRRPGLTLYIKDETVSQKHAILENKGGQWLVTDCHSSNGTSVNGHFLDSGATVELGNGDLITVGNDNEVRVKITGGPEEVDETFNSSPQALKVEDEVMKVTAQGLRWDDYETTRSQKPDPNVLTLKQWFEQEKVRQTAACEATAEAAVRELMEHTKLLQMEICEASGVNFL